MTITPVPFGGFGKLCIAVLVAGILALCCLCAYAYTTLPQLVPTHFGYDGEPTHYGGKEIILCVTATLCFVPIALLLGILFRFRLIGRIPSLISVPRFYMYVDEIREERRGYWVNRYFEIVAGMSAALTILLDAAGAMICNGYRNSVLSPWFPPTMLVLPALLVVPVIIKFRRLGRELGEEAGPESD